MIWRNGQVPPATSTTCKCWYITMWWGFWAQSSDSCSQRDWPWPNSSIFQSKSRLISSNCLSHTAQWLCFVTTLFLSVSYRQPIPHHDQTNGSDSVQSEVPKRPHIKKPLNAFMLFMKEMRATVAAECTLKESAAINQILGRRVSELVSFYFYFLDFYL